MKTPFHFFLLLLVVLIFPSRLLAQESEAIKAGDCLIVVIEPSASSKQDSVRERLVVLKSGKIKMPGLKQEVPAAGLTPAQLATSIIWAFAQENAISVPSLRVALRLTCLSHTITVSGEVRMPGEFPLRQDMTLMSAIIRSGGFSEFANRRKVKIIHKNGKTAIFDLRKIKPNGSNNPKLQEDDRIIVPR
ncbi:MAG: SLBB domain-containing protein [Verrucomicrobiota bacterium]